MQAVDDMLIRKHVCVHAIQLNSSLSNEKFYINLNNVESKATKNKVILSSEPR